MDNLSTCRKSQLLDGWHLRRFRILNCIHPFRRSNEKLKRAKTGLMLLQDSWDHITPVLKPTLSCLHEQLQDAISMVVRSIINPSRNNGCLVKRERNNSDLYHSREMWKVYPPGEWLISSCKTCLSTCLAVATVCCEKCYINQGAAGPNTTGSGTTNFSWRCNGINVPKKKLRNGFPALGKSIRKKHQIKWSCDILWPELLNDFDLSGKNSLSFQTVWV